MLSTNWLTVAPILVLTAGAAVAYLLATLKQQSLQQAISIACVTAALLFVAALPSTLGESGTNAVSLGTWLPAPGQVVPLNLRVDPLAVAFALATLVVLLGFAIAQSERTNNVTLPPLMLVEAACLLLFWADALLVVALAWTLLGLALFVASVERADGSATPGDRLVLAGMLAPAMGATLVGLMWLGADVDALSRVSFTQPPRLLVFVLIVWGVAAAALQVPMQSLASNRAHLHAWHAAHTTLAAPAGVYLLARLFSIETLPLSAKVLTLITVIGLLSVTVGIILAARAQTMRQFVAWQAVPPLGLIFVGLGAGAGPSLAAWGIAAYALSQAALLLITADDSAPILEAGPRGPRRWLADAITLVIFGGMLGWPLTMTLLSRNSLVTALKANSAGLIFVLGVSAVMAMYYARRYTSVRDLVLTRITGGSASLPSRVALGLLTAAALLGSFYPVTVGRLSSDASPALLTSGLDMTSASAVLLVVVAVVFVFALRQSAREPAPAQVSDVPEPELTLPTFPHLDSLLDLSPLFVWLWRWVRRVGRLEHRVIHHLEGDFFVGGLLAVAIVAAVAIAS